jgi:hypothetical protein
MARGVAGPINDPSLSARQTDGILPPATASQEPLARCSTVRSNRPKKTLSGNRLALDMNSNACGHAHQAGAATIVKDPALNY